jgi:hypothetical protein
VVFGVRKPLASWNPFWANVQVYAYLWFDAVRTRRWRDKIGIWFRRTGWRPQDVETRYPKYRSDIRTFRKYDPPLSPTLRYYLVGQFVVAVIGILWIGQLYATQGLAVVAIPCLLLWVQLYTLGMISDRKTLAVRFELARLNVVWPLGVLAITMTSTAMVSNAVTWFAVFGYALVSSFILRQASGSGSIVPASGQGEQATD